MGGMIGLNPAYHIFFPFSCSFLIYFSISLHIRNRALATEHYTINVRGRLVDLGIPQVMGVLNATPDSFYAGSRKQTERDIADRANRIIAEGGSMIDVGAYSTRPHAVRIDEEEEMRRMRAALAVVRREQPDAILSVDTFRPNVMRMAADEYGADIINDVSGGNADGCFGGTGDRTETQEPVFTALRLPYILTSSEPTIEKILVDFARKVRLLRGAGVKDIILDPGFGFGKTLRQNYEVLANLPKLRVMHLPVLVGVSRKSMIYNLFGTSPDEALNGTTVINTIALMQASVNILRVHDVKECVEAVKIVTLNSQIESMIRLPEQEISSAGDHEGRPYRIAEFRQEK